MNYTIIARVNGFGKTIFNITELERIEQERS
jgi:hypothetical protein